MELTCGNCQGQFIAAVPGSIVACPHCGIHLQTPAAETPAVSPPIPTSLPSSNVLSEVPIPAPVAAGSLSITPPPGSPTPLEPVAIAAGATTPPAVDKLTAATEAPVSVEPAVAAAPKIVEPSLGSELAPTPNEAARPSPPVTSPSDTPVVGPTESSGVLVSAAPNNPASASTPGLSWVVGASASTPTDVPNLFVAETGSASGVGLASAAVESQTVAPPLAPATDAVSTDLPTVAVSDALAPPPSDRSQLASDIAPSDAPAVELPPFATSTAMSRPAGVSRSAFVMTLAYAGLVTLLAAYLLFLLWRGHALESLPDLSPLGTGTVRIPAPRATVAPGHTLALGESKVFGYVRVTPLRVTRGPLELETRGPFGLEDHKPPGTVLKLWLKFENVSPTDDVVPLDRQLVFYRRADKRTPGRFMTFNFVCPRGKQKEVSPPLVYVYDQPPNSGLEPKAQNLDQNLGPNQAVETYIPTTAEGASDLAGKLLWRVHFRKGHNAKTRAGVTTLIDVVFDSSAIEVEPAAHG